jgi:hypothetical protein
MCEIVCSKFVGIYVPENTQKPFVILNGFRMFNAEDDNAERIDEDDDEEEIIAKMIDDSVKAACKVIDDSIKTSSNVQDEMNAKFVDDSTKQPSNEGVTFTQETILKFPEYLRDVNEE